MATYGARRHAVVRERIQAGEPDGSPGFPRGQSAGISPGDVHKERISIGYTAKVNAIGPTTVLVLPENSTGNFDIVLDSSNDLATWTPFCSQTVTAPSAANFYRARIVKTAEP
jgi:hypothetical protein